MTDETVEKWVNDPGTGVLELMYGTYRVGIVTMSGAFPDSVWIRGNMGNLMRMTVHDLPMLASTYRDAIMSRFFGET